MIISCSRSDIVRAVSLRQESPRLCLSHARIYPELELIAKKELEAGGGLELRVAQEAAREVLTSSESKTVKALRRELDDTKAIKLTQLELADLVSEVVPIKHPFKSGVKAQEGIEF